MLDWGLFCISNSYWSRIVLVYWFWKANLSNPIHIRFLMSIRRNNWGMCTWCKMMMSPKLIFFCLHISIFENWIIVILCLFSIFCCLYLFDFSYFVCLFSSYIYSIRFSRPRKLTKGFWLGYLAEWSKAEKLDTECMQSHSITVWIYKASVLWIYQTQILF